MGIENLETAKKLSRGIWEAKHQTGRPGDGVRSDLKNHPPCYGEELVGLTSDVKFINAVFKKSNYTFEGDERG